MTSLFAARFRARMALFFVLLLLLGLAMLFAPPFARGQGKTVDLVRLEGVIDPTTADYLEQRLDAAREEGVYGVILQLDTPGGLDVSMREMVGGILASEVPVIAWVAPRGARAASAGTFITLAANLAYMAEATEIGAASPVNLGGGEIPETEARKITNDAAAYIRSIAETRGRNADWAESAVREASSLPATQAVEENVVDGMASSLRDLLQAADGETVETGSGEELRFDTWDQASQQPAVTVRFQNMNLLQRLLHTITDPEIALLLITIGSFGIIFELFNPGIGLAGILGAVSLLLGFYALSVLPTNWAGVLLIVLGIVFFVVDLQVAGLGVWTAGGVAALVAGSLILFSGAAPALQLAPWAIVLLVVGSLFFFISVMTAALRVRLRRPVTGEESLVGTVGVAETDVAPEGMVRTKGTTWRARTMESGIAQGQKVKVMATEGLTLLVEPMDEEQGEEEEGPRR